MLDVPRDRVEDLRRLAHERAARLARREPDERLDEGEEVQCEPVLVRAQLERAPAGARGERGEEGAEDVERCEWVRAVVGG